jgi:hypothetical protein
MSKKKTTKRYKMTRKEIHNALEDFYDKLGEIDTQKNSALKEYGKWMGKWMNDIRVLQSRLFEKL